MIRHTYARKVQSRAEQFSVIHTLHCIISRLVLALLIERFE